MKLSAAALILPAALLGLAACADDAYSHHGARSGVSLAYYDGFYDDFYGPVYGGYWGPSDTYFYQTHARGPYLRDDAHHFRHEQFEHAHNFHYRDWGSHGRG